jgi:hypothetical protein
MDAEVSRVEAVRRTLWGHKVWTIVAVLLLIALVQFVFLGIGFGSGDSGIEGRQITTAP